MTTTTTMEDPDLTPDVIQARARFDAVNQRHAASDARLRRFETVLNPFIETDATEEEVFDAKEHVALARVGQVKLTRERREAESAWQTARAAARSRVQVACHERKRALITNLDALLTQAATASRELADLEDFERRVTGEWHRGGLAWLELAAGSPLQGSRLVDWRHAAREAQLLA